VPETETHVLVFIASYIGFKVLAKLFRELCKGELINVDRLQFDFAGEDYDYLLSVSRGGLQWPTDFLTEIVTQVYIVFKTLVSDKVKHHFMAASHQKSIQMHQLMLREVSTKLDRFSHLSLTI